MALGCSWSTTARIGGCRTCRDQGPVSASCWSVYCQRNKTERRGRVAERLGLGLIPGVGWRASEIRTIAREAEDAGFDAIVTAEVNNDALATAQLMGAATRQIKVGTWIASIHMRHSYACAKAAGLIADATDGRMILGLGVSRPHEGHHAVGEFSCKLHGRRRHCRQIN